MTANPRPCHVAALIALLMTGAIAGFFYAWVCSTMWGLDQTDPAVAIAAMQAMNASVRNAVFFPAFFLTPVALVVAAWLAWRVGARRGAVFLITAAATYALGAELPTMLVNVPMNEALALVALPVDPAEAASIWSDYSPRWQAWNIARTLASFAALALAGIGLLALPRLA